MAMNGWPFRVQRTILPLVVLLGLLIGSGLAHGGATPGSADNGASCYGDPACPVGGSIQFPDFFRGYATRGSAGVQYPGGEDAWPPAFGPTQSLQPVAYAVRPPWQVAGVDYAVGMPAAQMPTLRNLHPAALKDPAQVDTDPRINPNRDGANCRFYASNLAVPGGVAAGTGALPFPFANGGAGIYCNNRTGSATPLVFDGYNFGWNSVTGYGCVPLAIAARRWGTDARGTGMDSAAIIVRNSLWVEGPNCTIWGSIGAGASAGPEAAQVVFAINLFYDPTVRNSFAFYANTVYGCGGDANATAIERALCAAAFPSTRYDSGAIKGYASAPAIGIAPENGHFINAAQAGDAWISGNAFLHMPGHLIDFGNSNHGDTTYQFDHNYIEGMLYKNEPSANLTALTNTGGTQETLTTAAPHGVPVGGYQSFVLTGNGAGDFPAGWAGIWTMRAIDATHLVFDSPVNRGDWQWSGRGNQARAYSNYGHGELFVLGTDHAGASFNGTVSGTTLTINAMRSGTLRPGQYLTAQSGSGLSFPAGTRIIAGAGNSWRLNQPVANASGDMLAPYYTQGALGGITTINFQYNTVLSPPSTWGNGGTSQLYIAAISNNGVPYNVNSGSIDHNVFVTDLASNSHHVQSNRVISIDHTAVRNLALVDNYLDPTGSAGCIKMIQEESVEGLVIARNVNLLDPTDEAVNTVEVMSIVPYVPGTASGTQARNGIAYDAATGQVSVELVGPAPREYQAGAAIRISGGSVTDGPNYLAGEHTLTGVAGNRLMFSVAPGMRGTPNAAAPSVVVLKAGRAVQCHGHN
jgi:hypothetical protein